MFAPRSTERARSGHYALPVDRHNQSDMVRYLVELEHPYDPDRNIGVEPVELVRFAIGATDYWADLALGWLADGLAVAPLADVLRDYAADTTHPQSQRHR